MELEIVDAIDNGDKITLKLRYDESFVLAVEKAFGIKNITLEELEDIIMMVLENFTEEDLGELGDEID